MFLLLLTRKDSNFIDKKKTYSDTMENEETSILNTDKEPVSPNPLVKDFLPGGMTD